MARKEWLGHRLEALVRPEAEAMADGERLTKLILLGQEAIEVLYAQSCIIESLESVLNNVKEAADGILFLEGNELGEHKKIANHDSA